MIDITGSLTLDLTRLPRGAKSSNKCTLSLAGDESNAADMPMISLFKQRRIKGWWPFTAKNDQDELEITVRSVICAVSYNLSRHYCPFTAKPFLFCRIGLNMFRFASKFVITDEQAD